ncbi:MAG: tripartite tricarboxylate transporter substrate binding protein [Betaproteobacteria bacterium]|nr:tripartite tricarboxylate transporter substrate binding protein [Betaproteobacteria bacterium]
MKFRSMWFLGAAAVGLLGCAGMQEAPKYPTQPVTVVIPYPPGNAADLVGRAMAEKLAQLWAQPVNVVNRPGPTTVPGADSVAKAKADGLTLLVHSISFATDAGLFTQLPYDAQKDFIAIAGIAKQPFVLVTTPALGATKVNELVEKAKGTPLKYASLGPTTQITFVTEQFKKLTGMAATNAPQRSAAEANAAVMKGDAAFWFAPVAAAVPLIRDAKVTALGVTGDARSAALPQVPTMAEAGVPKLVSHAWFGLWAPTGVPKAVVDRIALDVDRALQAPDLLDKLNKLGAAPMRLGPAPFAAFVRSETDASRSLVGDLGIKPQVYTPPAKP